MQNILGSYNSGVGSPNDDHEDNTIYGTLDKLDDHEHRRSRLYPMMKAPVTLTTEGTAWTLGTPVGLTNTEAAIDNDVAVDAGAGVVTIPATGHHLVEGNFVKIDGSVNYDGTYEVLAAAANTFNIEATYVAEEFAGTETATDVIPDDFDIHYLNISALSANGDYEIIIFSGDAGSEVEIARIAATRNAVFSQEGSKSCQSPIIDAETRISAALVGSNAAANTCAIKFEYHTY